jgi:hypothetical protein
MILPEQKAHEMLYQARDFAEKAGGASTCFKSARFSKSNDVEAFIKQTG